MVRFENYFTDIVARNKFEILKPMTARGGAGFP